MLDAGLGARLAPERLVELDRPSSEFEAQSGTRIRNGLTIRQHALLLADAVESALSAGRFAFVLGGDCSILLGCLVGARRLLKHEDVRRLGVRQIEDMYAARRRLPIGRYRRPPAQSSCRRIHL
jgi:arginase family enzyme